jgi:hypothetical protein
MLKRVALAIGVLGALSGWVGAGALTAASAPKAHVGLFKDDAVAVIEQFRISSSHLLGPEGAARPGDDARRC